MRASIYILIVFCIFILSILYLYLHSATIQLTFILDEREEELYQIEEEVERLRIDITSLTSYPKIKNVAFQMGFVHPERIVVLDSRNKIEQMQVDSSNLTVFMP